VFVLWCVGAGLARASDPPRYKFTIGQEMVYREVDPPREQTDADGVKTVSRSTNTWTITAVDRNADGSFRLVNQEMNVFTRKGGSEDTRRERFTSGRFDLRHDGELTGVTELAIEETPVPFPRLPPDGHDLRTHWSDSFDFKDTKRTYRAVAPDHHDEQHWIFKEDTTDNFCLVEDYSVEHTYAFDVRRGLAERITSLVDFKARQDREAIRSTGVIELVSVRQLSAGELAAFQAESSRYFKAVLQSEEQIDLADRDLAQAAEHYDQGVSILRALAATLEIPKFQAANADKLKKLEASREHSVRDNERLARQIGRTSVAWTTTDLDGNPHALADYRGRVVLLDFWYRGCGWCITAMPEIKKLVDDFRDQPVTVLGMNHNANVEDGRHVVERLKLNYASLRDGDGDDAISKKYEISGWPTLVVLDGAGVIRHIHVGYTRTMRKQLGDKIRELLPDTQAAK
jgi:peroxiredoxin